MKTIKIIDLLNKIANGEDVPKKIKFNGKIYEYRGYMYCTEKDNYQDLNDYLFGHWNFLILNDEAEIIEEDKEIERLNNVIDKLEEYLNRIIYTSTERESITCKYVLQYLQELKGIDE